MMDQEICQVLGIKKKAGPREWDGHLFKRLDPTARKVMALGFIPPTDEMIHSHCLTDKDKRIKFILKAFCYENTSDVHIKIHF